MRRTRRAVAIENDLLITQLEDGHLEVREVYLDDEGEPYYHRYVIHPGMDVTAKSVQVKNIVAKAHTPRVIAAWEAAQALITMR